MDSSIIIGDNLYLKPVLKIHQSNRNEEYFHIFESHSNQYIGNCGIRLDKTEENFYLGNLEYEIFESYRGHHYSSEVCHLLAQIAYSNNLTSLLITTNVKNKASTRIIESLGANFLGIYKVPRKCKLYKQGDRKLKIYNWDFSKTI